jgi:hypothetical protein
VKQISVICAPAPGPNPGMSSVDLAFHGVAKRLGVDANVRYWHLYMPEELHGKYTPEQARQMQQAQRLPFDYDCFRDRLDEVYASDAIVYWGDFLQARDYHHDMSTMMVDAGISPTKPAALDIINRHMLLTEAPDDVLRKCMSFGGTLLFNRQREYCEEPYATQLSRYVRGAQAMWMREVYSALKISQIRGDYTKPHLGVDCSNLLRDDDIAALPTTPWSHDAANVGDRVAVFFGRSSTPAKVLAKFARDVCRKIERPADWLPWGDASAFEERGQTIRKNFRELNMPDRPGRPLVGDLFKMLSSYSLVISDTYHVCVNAWRLGVPAICVADTIFKGRLSISNGHAYAWRDKRQAFFSMYDANEFYVYDHELDDKDWRQRRIYQLSQVLPMTHISKAITANLHQHRDAAEQQLASELRALLA